MAKKVLIHTLAVPRNGARSTLADIQMTDGNLVLGGLTGPEPALASGELEYLQNQDQPEQSVTVQPGQTVLALKAGRQGQPWLRLPWAACNGATEWRIRLSPETAWEIRAHSGGGNVTLDLSGLRLTGLTAGSGGGNLNVSLPPAGGAVNAALKSGAGNVIAQVPAGSAVRVQATTGLGKVILPPQYQKMETSIYQTPGYDRAAERYDLVLSSGAGNVKIEERVTETAAAVLPA